MPWLRLTAPAGPRKSIPATLVLWPLAADLGGQNSRSCPGVARKVELDSLDKAAGQCWHIPSEFRFECTGTLSGCFWATYVPSSAVVRLLSLSTGTWLGSESFHEMFLPSVGLNCRGIRTSNTIQKSPFRAVGPVAALYCLAE